MESRKFLKVKGERLISVNHIPQKRILDSPKLCLATKSDPVSKNSSKNIHFKTTMSLETSMLFLLTPNTLGNLKAQRLEPLGAVKEPNLTLPVLCIQKVVLK